MHVDRYANVYRLEEFKTLHCGLEKINQSKNDACSSLEEYPHFSLSLYHKRQVNVHCSLAYTRNIQLRCDCLQGAIGASTGIKTMKLMKTLWKASSMSEKQKAKIFRSRAINSLAVRFHYLCCALRRRQVDS